MIIISNILLNDDFFVIMKIIVFFFEKWINIENYIVDFLMMELRRMY